MSSCAAPTACASSGIPASSCGKPLDADWRICPYCETDRGLDPTLAAPPAPHAGVDPEQTMVAPPPSDLTLRSTPRSNLRAAHPPAQPRINKETRPMAERTLILVKPDAFARNLTGEIIARFERKGLKLAALKLETLTRETAEQPLRRAQRQAVLRRARRVHHVRSAGRDGARGRLRGRGRPSGDRRHQPAAVGSRLDPRRLRHLDRHEHGPRLRLARVGGA